MPPKPNVILILVDDMGFSDLGVTGSEIGTPNIDTALPETASCCRRCTIARAAVPRAPRF